MGDELRPRARRLRAVACDSGAAHGRQIALPSMERVVG